MLVDDDRPAVAAKSFTHDIGVEEAPQTRSRVFPYICCIAPIAVQQRKQVMSVANIYANVDRDATALGRAGWGRALRGFLSRLNKGLDRAAESRRVDQVRDDADYVRGLAGRMLYMSPGMAADLLAAADRHERELGR